MEKPKKKVPNQYVFVKDYKDEVHDYKKGYTIILDKGFAEKLLKEKIIEPA